MMQLSEGQHPIATATTAHSEHPDIHYLHLKNAIPEWLGKASPARRQALKSTRPQLPGRLKAAPARQHAELKALNAAHWTAQNDVDRTLEHLQDASGFAEPLLRDALKTRFGLDLDVRKTFLRLYIPATIPWFPVKSGAARAWTVSLLDAALHNFEDKETEDDAYGSDSTFITEPSSTGQFDTLPAVKEKITIQAFTQLCRELDIGGQYKTYLEDNLGVSNPVVAAVLRPKVEESQKAALKAALQFARMNGDIREDYFRLIHGLLDGLQGMRLNGQDVLCHDLTMMSDALTGIVVFAPDLERAREVVRVVAYIPDDPEHPIKEYASSVEMMEELTRQLRSSDYQRFFSRFVAHEQRGHFFANLKNRLTEVTWHQHEKGDPLPSWQETPIDNPDLQFAATPINENLWRHLYQGKLNKILNDARVIAVSTATVDQKARWALWDSFVNIASTILEIAAFVAAPFVPFLGEIMMAYMAWQLLDETFEGIIEWAQGRTTEAFEHLMGVVESLIQLGFFAAGGVIGAGEFRNVLPSEIVNFIDRFKPVQIPNGETRYWEPDLTAYEHKSTAPQRSRPNRQGLHQHEGKNILPIEQTHYAVSKAPLTGRYQIEHPTRPDAYKPTVLHNGDGAWHTELEQPLEWDTPTALRRIGHSVESFSPARREQILKVSGYPENALRKMHVNHEPLPPLLADTIKRFKIDQDLQRFTDQISSDRPEHYRSADPLTQLQTLKDEGLWPDSKRLRFVNEQGEIAWESSTNENLPLTEIRQDRLNDGDLLKTLLQTLSEDEVKALLGEESGGGINAVDVRTRTLRTKLAQVARKQNASRFDSRYKALEQSENPLLQNIMKADPELPASVAQELLNTATGSELQQISTGQWPERQKELADLAKQEVRVTRAYEGLELNSVKNPDTDTLALHSLERLPNWSSEVRIEVRDRSYEAQTLDSIGRQDAPIQKVLARQTDGTYQPYDNRGQTLSGATDFYSSILQALPDAERQALDINIGQGAKLKQAIREQPLGRNELRTAISHQPIREPVVDTLRLLGTEGYPRIPNEPPRTLQERVVEVYPRLSPEEVQALTQRLQSHPAGARAELSRLRDEYIQLENDLHIWANNPPHAHPVTNAVLSPLEMTATTQNRRLLRDEILRCWRRETGGNFGYTLQFLEPILGDLPTLSADFSHVSILSLNGSSATRAVHPFLEHFPGLLRLEMHDFTLDSLPQAISTMPALRQLRLRDCGIVLTPDGQTTLSSLSSLTALDLHGNPLRLVPDVQAMPALSYIRMSNTGISTLPNGLSNHPRLRTAIFSGNRISELPEALFDLPTDISKGLDFANNPLSATTRERIKTHYSQTGQNFRVLAEQADLDRTTALYPDLDFEQASDLIYRLPGTLDEGRIQLSHWEAEFARLSSDLGTWARDVPDLHPSTDQPLDAVQMYAEHVAREEFGQNLKRLWRQRLAGDPAMRAASFQSNLAIIGDMPALTADFSHVSHLSLNGSSTVGATEPLLRLFTGLRSLEMRNFTLEHVPQAITGMPALEKLVLSNCGAVLTPQSQAILSSLENLSILDLYNNPLGIVPSVEAMPGLTYIDLSNTGISSVPAGLSSHPRLRTAIFSGNQITELPDALFNLPGSISEEFDFGNNPLSSITRDRIKTYYRQTGQDLGVLAEQGDIDRTKALYPALDNEEASDFIYRLPGTLDEGRIELTRREAEITDLINDLTVWMTDIPDHPITGEPLNAEDLLSEQYKRKEFKESLERCWRQLPAENVAVSEYGFVSTLPIMGDLPVLTADFSHVPELYLTSAGDIVPRASRFLEYFPSLDSLSVRGYQLDNIPEAVFGMGRLTVLSLPECRITLTPETVGALAGMEHLDYLNLRDNPLGLTPDLSNMTVISSLNLSQTGISEIPRGLFNIKSWTDVDLSNNAITEMPAELMEVPPDISDGFNFSGNPFSAESLQRIATYFHKTGNDLGIAGVAGMPPPVNMPPAVDIED